MVIGALVAVVVLAAAVVLAVVVGHRSPAVPPSDAIAVPSSPPPLLGGQALNPQGMEQSSSMATFVTQVAAISTSSFGAFYGAYPPRTLPTTSTFIVIASEPIGGTGGPGQLAATVEGEMQREKEPGSQLVETPEQSSVFGGGIVCGSMTTGPAQATQCIWQNDVVSVQVNTYSSNLAAVAALTVQVVTELHDETPGK